MSSEDIAPSTRKAPLHRGFYRDIHVQASALLLTVVTVLFILFPELDLTVTRSVRRWDDGFAPKDLQPYYTLYQSVPWGIALGVTVILLAWGWGRYRGQPVLGLGGRQVLFILGGLVIGPGLIVNSLLKEHWGRARPSQLLEFGGTLDFTPPWMIASQCLTNCSFASGHAAAAFFLISLGFVWRKGWLFALGIAWGMAVGAVRIMQGGHFLSDVLISGAIVYWVYALLAVWLLPPEERSCEASRASWKQNHN